MGGGAIVARALLTGCRGLVYNGKSYYASRQDFGGARDGTRGSSTFVLATAASRFQRATPERRLHARRPAAGARQLEARRLLGAAAGALDRRRGQDRRHFQRSRVAQPADGR